MSSDTLSLAGKVAIVTGSGRKNGIGAAIAYVLAERGAAVIVHYFSNSTAGRAAEADLTDPKAAKYLVEKTMEAFKTDKIDILVNNAGNRAATSILDSTAEEIEDLFRSNVYGPIYVTQAVVPHMPPGGQIINTLSIGSKLGLEAMPLYYATKATLDSLTYIWAAEFGKKYGITVNSVALGPVATNKVPLPNNPLVQMLVGLTRLESRMGLSREVADVVLFLASPLSRWVTGQYISASGGITGG
ncbi:NAD(P)-binding protein [Cenococcum geophilum 1.58]|uniref:NAD(P)-binding protein n=1 Tax=Cenococcum geophilum 1.58 TaxID=794803 RepID=A0ACC8EPV3_9PEZI|nr:NAD(P)-binding protein [Cenococcum geophilum 1.58]